MFDLGDELDIYCRYCKKNLHGVVTALVEGEIAKVKCRTCGHFQVYKPPKDMKKAKQRALKRLMKSYDKKQAAVDVPKESASMGQDAAIRALWDKETESADFRNTKVYEVYRTYAVNDFIAHKSLGLGKVMEATENSLKVLFRDRIEDVEQARPRDEYND